MAPTTAPITNPIAPPTGPPINKPATIHITDNAPVVVPIVPAPNLIAIASIPFTLGRLVAERLVCDIPAPCLVAVVIGVVPGTGCVVQACVVVHVVPTTKFIAPSGIFPFAV
jgi:hypothetical protein